MTSDPGAPAISQALEMSTDRAPLWGALLLVGVVGVDVAFQDSLVLIPVLVLAPLVAALGGQPRHTLQLGVATVVAAVGLGWVDGIEGSWRHVLACLTLGVVALTAWLLARHRSTRERALRRVAPVVERSLRLASTITAGRMGEWTWDSETGVVSWDPVLVGLFGLETGAFEGTFDAWIDRVDPRDRTMVLDQVERGLLALAPFRFDHRCVWPDGTVHWLEGIGEPVTDRRGQVVGAAGLTLSVDDRYAALEERNRLLGIEAEARRRAEFVARVHDVLARSLDAEEILGRVTRSMVPDLGDWCAAVLAIDRPVDAPLLVAAHSDDAMQQWADDVQRRFPYDPDAPFGAARVIRTGEREVLADVAPLLQLLEGREVLEQADVNGVLTVPIVGQLGVLGAIQLIRGRSKPAFGAHDIELVEELAGRCGAALHASVLFARQAAGRSALDTLQQVSGALASAATFKDVAQAVLLHGRNGLRALGAAVYVVEDDVVRMAASEGVPCEQVGESIDRLAQKSVDESLVMSERLDDASTTTIVPLVILGRTIGALAFVIEWPRVLTEEEQSMLLTLAARCAGATERASLYERERDTALVLQRRLLPDLSPVPNWVEVAARYEPATGGPIGGDWFQLADAGDGRVMAVVGDAVGHGMASAAAMGQLRASISTAVSTNPDPAAVLAIVDRFAAQGLDTLAATVAVAMIDEEGGLLHASAGHPPMVFVPASGPARVLDGGRRPVLGFGDPAGNSRSAISSFGPGDTIVMYTDGLIERRGASIDHGMSRLVACIDRDRHLAPQELCDAIIDFMDVRTLSEDDVAVLVIRKR